MFIEQNVGPTRAIMKKTLTDVMPAVLVFYFSTL